MSHDRDAYCPAGYRFMLNMMIMRQAKNRNTEYSGEEVTEVVQNLIAKYGGVSIGPAFTNGGEELVDTINEIYVGIYVKDV